jgi:hypothetical protein
MEILDQEAEEDEEAREAYDGDPQWPPSYEANKPLISKETRYRAVLQKAGVSDDEVRQKWYDWEEAIMRLTWDEVISLTALSIVNHLAERDACTGEARGICSVLDRLSGREQE